MRDYKLPELEVESVGELDNSMQQLSLAILYEALQSYLNSVGKSFLDAKKWIFSDDYSYGFSYVSVCSNLGIDPGYLRKGIKAKESNPHRLSRRF